MHFPWCLSKCGYCDFYSVALSESTPLQHDGYADAVIAELERRLEPLSLPPLTSLFFGGGTPSLWRADAIKRVIDATLAAFAIRDSALEITVECNPSSFDQAVADGLLSAGVNRVSLGIQSLDDAQLAFLGRRHDSQRALAALDIALASGLERVSVDYLYGLPKQRTDVELGQLRELASRPLSHVSAYALTIEEATPFGRLARQGRLPIAPEDRVAEAFEAVHAELEGLGYEHYEISNFARPGRRSLHNQQYWWGSPYLGLGAAAFGTVELGGRWLRYRNPANVPKYLALPFGDRSIDVFAEGRGGTLDQLEWLDAEMRLRERILLGLRLREGVDIDSVAEELQIDFWTPERRRAVDRLLAQGRLSQSASRLYIEPSAWLLADGTIAQLM